MLTIVALLGALATVFVGDKIASGSTTAPADLKTGISTWGPFKLAIFVTLMAAGAFVALFLGKKLKILNRR